MLKVIFFFVGVYLFSSCDQFSEEVKTKGKVILKTSQRILKTDCENLIAFGDNILRLKVLHNGVVKNIMSGFEIIKAKTCPTLRISDGENKIEFLVELKKNRQIRRCNLVANKKIVCPAKK